MNLNVADLIIKVKEKFLIDLERAKNGLETTVGAKFQMRLRNDAMDVSVRRSTVVDKNIYKWIVWVLRQRIIRPDWKK